MKAAHDDRDRVLVVEDDATISMVIAGYLQRAGLSVEVCADGLTAIASAVARRPLAVLLDLNLPGCSGLDVLRALQAAGDTPVIMVTSRRDEASRIRGLQLGADDYVMKPFSPRELTERVRALLRRCDRTRAGKKVVVAGGLRVEIAERRVWVGRRCVELTALEQALLIHLMQHPGTTMTRADLLERVWGFTHGEESAVTVQIRRLRAKIEDDAAHPRRIVTVWAKGYRFDADQVSPAA